MGPVSVVVEREGLAGRLKKALVTGGAGFIGSHLVRRLVAEGRQVRVVDDLSTGKLERLTALLASIDFVNADLAAADLGPIVSGCDTIFHLAAVPSVPRSVQDPVTTHSSVATATLRLLVSARDRGAERVILSSSSSVYGETTGPKREDMPLRPLSPYAVAKVASESYARVFADLYGVRAVSLRYFNVFGPEQDLGSQYAAVIPRFISRALQGETLVIHGDGDQTRDFTFVEDVVSANLAASRSAIRAGVYNIAAGSPHTINELASTLMTILGRRVPLEHADPRPGDIRHSHADVTAAARDLGWHARCTFEDGLRRTVESYREMMKRP
jgi:UDP-glucose 4-epimerase